MESCKSKKYIHYGHKKFERERFTEIINREMFVKPFGGLWASPVDAEYGWKTWCKDNDFRKCDDSNSFTFTLSENAVVRHIFSVDDLKYLPEIKNELTSHGLWYCLDFERMLKDGIDAIELHLSCDNELYWLLYGWDCDSILIMNPDVIMCEGE